MNDVSKKLRVLSATQVKQSAGGVAIKAGVRAGLAVASSVLSTSMTETDPPQTPTLAKM